MKKPSMYLENFSQLCRLQSQVNANVTQILCHVPSWGRTGTEQKPSKGKIHKVQNHRQLNSFSGSHEASSRAPSRPVRQPRPGAAGTRAPVPGPQHSSGHTRLLCSTARILRKAQLPPEMVHMSPSARALGMTSAESTRVTRVH